MAIRGQRRTIGQKAQHSGYSRAIGSDKFQKEMAEKSATFLEDLVAKAEKAASAKAKGASPWLKAAALLIPNSLTLGIDDMLVAGYDAQKKYKQGQHFNFKSNMPGWAKGTGYEDWLKGQATGIEAETESSFKNRMNTSALLAALPAATAGIGAVSDYSGQLSDKAAQQMTQGVSTATMTQGQKDLFDAFVRKESSRGLAGGFKLADLGSLPGLEKFGWLGKIAKFAQVPKFPGTEGVWGSSVPFIGGESLPSLAQYAGLAAGEPKLLDFLTGGLSEPMIAEKRQSPRAQFTNPYRRRY